MQNARVADKNFGRASFCQALGRRQGHGDTGPALERDSCPTACFLRPGPFLVSICDAGMWTIVQRPKTRLRPLCKRFPKFASAKGKPHSANTHGSVSQKLRDGVQTALGADSARKE